MPSPTLTFAFILATLYGAAFHLVLGGDGRRLVMLLLSSWFGFALGQMVGMTFGIDVFNIGALRIVAATFGSLVSLFVISVLTSSRVRRKRSAH